MAGADPGVRNVVGETVLDTLTHSFASSEDPLCRLMQTFVDELFRCVAAADLGRVRSLVAAGLPLATAIDAPTTRNSALHWAASFGTADVVLLLIHECGAAVNSVNTAGWTALHDAVERGDAAVVAALLECGADPDMVIPSGKLKGKSARDMALSKVCTGNTAL